MIAIKAAIIDLCLQSSRVTRFSTGKARRHRTTTKLNTGSTSVNARRTRSMLILLKARCGKFQTFRYFKKYDPFRRADAVDVGGH